MGPGTVLGKVLGPNITGAFSQTWPHGTCCHTAHLLAGWNDWC